MMIKIQTIKEHKKIKQNLLDLIKKSKSEKFTMSVYEQITKTDFNNSNVNEEYKDVVIKYIEPYTRVPNFCTQQIHDMWFQQYEKNDNHGWHIHPGCHFSHIYLLELPSKKYLPEFYVDKLVKINAKEGDLISFPATIIHRSPKITGNKRKTVIVYNTSFDEPDETLINIDNKS